MFSHTPPARALPPVGACRIEFPFSPPVSRAPGVFSHAPPPALFLHMPRPRGAPIVSHTSPARALPPVGAFRIEFPFPRP